jgi:multidrug resistance efflux pump
MRMMRVVSYLVLGALLGVGGTIAYRQVANPVGPSSEPPSSSSPASADAAGGLSAAGGGSAGGSVASAGASVTTSLPVATSAEAEVRPLRSAELAFPVPGVLAERLVQVGDEVQAGAALLRLDSSDEQALLRQAEAALAASAAQVGVAQAAEEAAKQQVAAADAAVDVAKAQLDGADTAVRQTLGEADATVARAKAQRAAAAAGVTQAEAAALQARAAYQQAKAAVTEAGARRDQAAAARDSAALAVDRRTLRAPFAGRVMAVGAEVGEAVGSGGAAAAGGSSAATANGAASAAVTLADTSAWLVDTTNLTERQVVGVQVGRRVTVSVDALPGRTFRGEVERVSGVSRIVRGDVTYVATVRILPGDGDAADLALLRPGMTAVVKDLVR